MYDLAIVGGGPAGVSAGVYAARKKLKTIFIAETIGGQSTDSVGVENWIGTTKVAGLDLAKMLEAHLREYASDVVVLKIRVRAEKLEKQGDHFLITTTAGVFEAKAVLIATGGMRKRLDIPGGKEFENKGISYCASCDGPLFSGMDVAVVGGGNAGFESAMQLLAYAKSVTLIHRSSEFNKADPATVDVTLKHPNLTCFTDTEPVEIKGSGFVSSIVVKNKKTNETREIPVGGIFVEIGMLPSTNWVKGAVDLDEYNRVKVDSKNQRTSALGVWAAGDCTDELYHQNNIAAGDAVKALEDIYYWIKSRAA